MRVEQIVFHSKNQESGLNKASIDHVTKAVLDRAEKTKDENLKWLYSKPDRIIGPHSWHEIQDILRENPKALVNVAGSRIMLPLELILFTLGILK